MRPLLSSIPISGRPSPLVPILVLLLAGCAQGKLGDGPLRGDGPDAGGGADDDDPVNPGDDTPPIDDVDAGTPADNCTPTAVNLLSNPSFDDGPGVGWLENDTGGVELVVAGSDTGVPTQTPNHAGWLGGINNSVHAVMQPLLIPADATGLIIRGYRNIATADNDTNADKLRVRLTDATFNILELLADPIVACADCTYSNTSGNTGGAYAAFTLTPAGNYAGQAIYLHIQSNLDSSRLTDFVLDTLVAEVSACP